MKLKLVRRDNRYFIQIPTRTGVVEKDITSLIQEEVDRQVRLKLEETQS